MGTFSGGSGSTAPDPSYGAWDLAPYAEYAQSPQSRPSGTRSPTSGGRSTYTSDSGNVRTTVINPGGQYDTAGQASRWGTIAGNEPPPAWPNGWPTTYGSTTYGGGGGGGGGGSIPPDWDAIYGLIGAGGNQAQYGYTPYEFTPAGPGQQFQFTPAGPAQQYQWQDAQWTNLDVPEYQGTGFYDFNTGQYDAAREGIRTGISDARQRGSSAFDRADQMYANYSNPYQGGPQTYNPGTDPRLIDSMNAWGGAGSYDAAQVNQEGVQADAAMRSVYDLLGSVDRRFNEGQRAAIMGDRMEFDQRLNSQANMMNLSVNMALAKAQAEYEKEKWIYGEEIARMNYETKKQQLMYNNQGINQVAMANNQGRNQAGMQNVQWGNERDMYNNQGINQAGMYNVGLANDRDMYNNMGINQAGMANNQGVNQANQSNVTNQNNWNQSVMAPILDLFLSGQGGNVDMAQLLAAFNQGGTA